MKTNRWMTFTAAILITVCEVLVFTSQSARVPEVQAIAAAGSHLFSASASIYRAMASGTRAAQRGR